jgi:hypothetical protein
VGFKSIIKKIGKVGLNQGLPIADAFGVPGAGLVHDAVTTIQKDSNRPNDDAVTLTASAVDELDARTDDHETRLQVLEKRAGIKHK